MLQTTKEFRKHDIAERRNKKLATHLAATHGLAVDDCQAVG